MMGKGLEWVSENKSRFRSIYLFVLAGFSIAMIVLTLLRIPIWKRGDALFGNVIETYPNMPFAYDNLGFYYYSKITDVKNPQNPYENYKNEKITFKEVDELYTKCLSLDPNFNSAYSNRGVLYFNMKRHQESYNDFEKALKLKPSNKDALIGAANALSELKRFQESIPYYLKYLELNPKDDNAWMWLGTAYTQSKKYDEALVDFKKAAELNAKNGQVFYKRGLLNFELKKYDAAIVDLKKAIELMPENSEVYSWLAWVYYNENNDEQALVYLNKAAMLNPKDVFAQKTRASSLLRIKEKSESAYQNALNTITTKADVYTWIGAVYIERKDFGSAIQFINQALAINPKDLVSLQTKGDCLYKMKRQKEAIPVFNSILAANPNDFIALEFRAHCFYDLKMFKPALVDVQKLQQLGKFNDAMFLKILLERTK